MWLHNTEKDLLTYFRVVKKKKKRKTEKNKQHHVKTRFVCQLTNTQDCQPTNPEAGEVKKSVSEKMCRAF